MNSNNTREQLILEAQQRIMKEECKIGDVIQWLKDNGIIVYTTLERAYDHR
jgi:hypothetical protein